MHRAMTTNDTKTMIRPMLRKKIEQFFREELPRDLPGDCLFAWVGDETIDAIVEQSLHELIIYEPGVLIYKKKA